MTDKERLEEIKDAIAHELGLTDDYMDGTYLYYLTRSKSAFAVGTMTLDDFKEIDEELLDEIFNAIEPFFIEQAEKVEYWRKQHRKRCNELEDAYFKIQLIENQIHQAQAKAERYEKALEFYADEETYETKFTTDTDEIYDPFTLIELDNGEIARKALEGEE